jgi:hypothetical protein
MKRRPKSKLLLQKLKEVVRYILDEESEDMEISGDFTSWKESTIEDFVEEKQEKVVEFSLDLKFISYT